MNSEPAREIKMNFAKLSEAFWAEGYVRLGKLFVETEVQAIETSIKNCDKMNECYVHAKKKYDDGAYPSFETIFVMNNVFTDNIYALACRKKEILDSISFAFGDAYLYHSKVPLKYPLMPGFKYHQDYFYWYQMGCVFPNMATCFIAIDKSTKENGCLKFIPKSHLCGRMDHILYDGFSDSEANPERVELLKEKYGEIYAELEPGEAVIFHCNLLHASETNLSDRSRIGLLGCYNTKSNNPINTNWDHPQYQKQTRFNGIIGPTHINALPNFGLSFKK